ncbi:SHOCT domain-containing protein [Demequina sp. B12]|uniref:SHOCT domain-containing protein n=1 Tax=Demequina sp. B12 TaxID=2992757 RepID=UPI00237AAF26|nr:SHOCT domain-containing protein [Demequina sp. B12]MDE0573871.1 SHOCT domain-containing protein [Demequina sp. B12]
MARRIGRPGLLGTMARTAVISGTATAVSGGVARRQAGRAQARQQQQYVEQQQAAQVQAAPAAPAAVQASGASDDLMAQLSKLAEMKAAGVLSEAEFAAAKAKLLG